MVAREGLNKSVKCICSVCGKVFYVWECNIKEGRGKTCSPECRTQSRRTTVNAVCQNCGKEFQVWPSKLTQNRGKYCSQACMIEVRRSIYRGENHPHYVEKVIKKCLNCGKTIIISPHLEKIGAGKYCSQVCHFKHRDRTGPNGSFWKGGLSFEPYCYLFNEEFKERVRHFYGNKCVLCGANNGNRRLCVHHVNYDKDACCNSSEKLFVALCNGCHNKTNTNREKWQVLFRDMIFNQYNGKCYLTKAEWAVIE